MGSNPIGGTLFNCSLPLAADRALDSAYFVVARRRKSVVCSLLLSTAARDPGLNCSLRALLLATARCGSRFGICRLRRRSQTEKRCLLAPSTLLAPLAEAGACKPLPSSLARRRKTCLLPRSSRTAARQPGSARRRAIRGLDCSDSQAHSCFKAGRKGSLPSVSVD